MRIPATLSAVLCPLPLVAGSFIGADVVVLGEYHDNPHHHIRQAELTAEILPKALVFEMLSAAQAEAHVPGATEEVLQEAFDWEASGWPDFSMYYPIFAAAPDAQVYGAAVPRDQARAVMGTGVVDAFGLEAAAFGLDQPLAQEEQTAREALQMAAHCDALPENMLPMMVDIQRLRDAELARATLMALEDTGGPVVVITGNGHARADWGLPVYLRKARPDVTITTLGQGEVRDGTNQAPEGMFDVVEYSPDIARDDPCAAFAKD